METHRENENKQGIMGKVGRVAGAIGVFALAYSPGIGCGIAIHKYNGATEKIPSEYHTTWMSPQDYKALEMDAMGEKAKEYLINKGYSKEEAYRLAWEGRHLPEVFMPLGALQLILFWDMEHLAIGGRKRKMAMEYENRTNLPSVNVNESVGCVIMGGIVVNVVAGLIMLGADLKQKYDYGRENRPIVENLDTMVPSSRGDLKAIRYNDLEDWRRSYIDVEPFGDLDKVIYRSVGKETESYVNGDRNNVFDKRFKELEFIAKEEGLIQ